MRFLVALVLSISCLGVAQAGCTGQDLIAALPAPDRAALTARAAAEPFPAGNLWRATKPGSTITAIGTLHLYDPRMDAMMKTIAPLVGAADLVLVEAGTKEMAELNDALKRQPDLLFRNESPTLPEALSGPEWAALSAELSARGFPPFLAAKMQPWYVSVLLGVPPCAMGQLAIGSSGLDHLILASAEAAGTPVRALEPYDTAFRLFQSMSLADQLDMVRASLAVSAGAEDTFATLIAAYFSGQHRLIWEFTRMQAESISGFDPAKMRADFNMMEAALLTGRNQAWMSVLLPAAMDHTVVVAVGAAHLSGAQGVLNLLADAGYTLEPLALAP